MVRFGSITVERQNLYNLTGDILYAYTSTGQIVVLIADESPTRWTEDIYLIVPQGDCSKYVQKGYRYDNLVCAVTGGIGREGDPMSRLFLYSDPSCRIYPSGE